MILQNPKLTQLDVRGESMFLSRVAGGISDNNARLLNTHNERLERFIVQHEIGSNFSQSEVRLLSVL